MLSNRHAINEVVYDGTRQWWVRWQLYRAPLQPDSRGTVWVLGRGRGVVQAFNDGHDQNWLG